jgi:hypothetical protein
MLTKSQLYLLITGCTLIVGVGGFYLYAVPRVAAFEDRVKHADFDNIHQENFKAEVEDSGKLAGIYRGVGNQKDSISVASLRLIPPGQYTAFVIGQEKGHKTNKNKQPIEYVLAAKDASGHWFPKQAAQSLPTH